MVFLIIVLCLNIFCFSQQSYSFRFRLFVLEEVPIFDLSWIGRKKNWCFYSFYVKGVLFDVLLVVCFSSTVLRHLSSLNAYRMINSLSLLMGVGNVLLLSGLVPYYQDNVLIWVTASVWCMTEMRNWTFWTWSKSCWWWYINDWGKSNQSDALCWQLSYIQFNI